MAGVTGLEPASDGVRVRCLAIWRHPNVRYANSIKIIRKKVNEKQAKNITKFYCSALKNSGKYFTILRCKRKWVLL